MRVIPRSRAFAMSYTVRSATVAAVSASISTPVLPTVRATASTRTSREARVGGECHRHVRQRDRVTERDQVGGPFRGHDAGDARGGQHVALGHGVRHDGGERGRAHRYGAGCACHTGGVGLGADVHHPGATVRADVGQSWGAVVRHDINRSICRRSSLVMSWGFTLPVARVLAASTQSRALAAPRADAAFPRSTDARTRSWRRVVRASSEWRMLRAPCWIPA
jgi:hypothetical protein